jgi:urease gamma subunit
MDDIRLFETDGDFLVLEAQDGQKFRLLVDDTVRSSIKKEKLQQLDAISITPREIQEEIRNGTTIDELISRSGATFEYIEKFAAPVIAELEHIVSSALSVRLTIAGDRYNDSSQIEFGEIIIGRLVTSGATGITWIAKKIEPNSWQIIANYLLNGAQGSATWSFDPRRLTLSPESETAITLSSQETINNSVIPKLRTVEAPSVAETVVMEDVIPIGRGAEFETPVAQQTPIVESDFERPEPSTPAAFLKPVQDLTAVPEEESASNSQPVAEPLSATADLLEALRRKRTEREDSAGDVANLESHPDTSSVRVIDIEVPKTEEQNLESNSPSTPPKKGRATMPSWDEIVFGTKADD